MSGKQKSRQIKEKRAAHREQALKAEAAALKERLESEGVKVNVAALASYNSYGPPKFVELGFYLDQPFTCEGCGKLEIWTAHQQKWWYEIAKGDVWSLAKLCIGTETLPDNKFYHLRRGSSCISAYWRCRFLSRLPFRSW